MDMIDNDSELKNSTSNKNDENFVELYKEVFGFSRFLASCCSIMDMNYFGKIG